MSRALVTGAGGFIGRHLIERLRHDGYAVRALVREAGCPGDWPVGVEVVAGDVRDPQAMKAAAAGCRAIFHLAGKAHALTEVQGDEEVYRAVNTEGTRHIMEGAVAGGAERFVLFSSVKAMGEGGSRCLDEAFNGRPETPYGRSKLEAERLVWEIGARAGLHVSCLRLPLVYGPGNKGNLFRMIAAIDKGRFPPLPELGNRRSVVHVANVVEAAFLAAGAPVANGQCYIVTDGLPYSTRELYEWICLALGRPIPRWHVPVWALRLLGYAGDAVGRLRGRRFLFDSDALDKLIGSAWYSSEKIARELGYRPSVTFEQALPELIAWYRKSPA
jgi:nucleoside-diphosphate-sugar epimerase